MFVGHDSQLSIFLPPRSGTHCWSFQFVGEWKMAHRETLREFCRRPGVAAKAAAGRRRRSPSSWSSLPKNWCGSMWFAAR